MLLDHVHLCCLCAPLQLRSLAAYAHKCWHNAIHQHPQTYNVKLALALVQAILCTDIFSMWHCSGFMNPYTRKSRQTEQRSCVCYVCKQDIVYSFLNSKASSPQWLSSTCLRNVWSQFHFQVRSQFQFQTRCLL